MPRNHRCPGDVIVQPQWWRRRCWLPWRPRQRSTPLWSFQLRPRLLPRLRWFVRQWRLSGRAWEAVCRPPWRRRRIKPLVFGSWWSWRHFRSRRWTIRSQQQQQPSRRSGAGFRRRRREKPWPERRRVSGQVLRQLRRAAGARCHWSHQAARLLPHFIRAFFSVTLWTFFVLLGFKSRMLDFVTVCDNCVWCCLVLRID